MQKFIGTKMIKAKPMNRLEYNRYRGWELSTDENGADEGMLVEYIDGGKSNHPNHEGYISWSPKEVFEKSYKATEGLTFGIAAEALKLGLMIRRRGWNEKGLFVFMQVPSKISIDIVPKMQSLPEAVKQEFLKRNQDINYSNQLAIVYPDSSIYGWTPSPSDSLANDWEIILD